MKMNYLGTSDQQEFKFMKPEFPPPSKDSSDTTIKKGYVRVSDILRPYQDFSMIDPEVLSRKARIGTEVHSAIEAHYKKEFCPLSLKAKEYIPSFKSALAGEMKGYKPKLLEKRFYDDNMKITGQIDMLATHPDAPKEITLIDFKTSAKSNLPIWSLQVALYAILSRSSGYQVSEKAYILHLKKKGSYAFICIPLTSSLVLKALHAVELYWHFH